MVLTAPSAACGRCFKGTSGLLPALRPQQTPEQTDWFVGAHPQGVPREVSRPAAPVSPAQEPARICLEPASLRLRQSHRQGEWRRPRRVRHWFEDKKRAGMRYSRPADAGDEHGVGPSAQRHRPQALRHERLPPSRRVGEAFLTGLAHLYNLIPYQRRALNAGKCGVEIEGGRVPTSGWCSTCRSSRQVAIDQRDGRYHVIRWNVKIRTSYHRFSISRACGHGGSSHRAP